MRSEHSAPAVLCDLSRYIHDAEAFPVLFELRTDKYSDQRMNQQKCDEIVRWLKSAALAFLSAHVRQDPLALQWLQSNNLGVASRGVATWQRK